MAMTIFSGWSELFVEKCHGTDPDTEESFVIFAHTAREKIFAYEPYILISQVLTKDGEDFTDDEIFSIASIDFSDREGCGGYGPVEIHMKTGVSRTIDFSGIEGHLLI